MCHHLFNLNDDDTAVIVHCLSDRRILKRRDFFFRRNIAGFIGIGAAKKSRVNGKCRIKELFLPFNSYQLNNIFGCTFVDSAAAIPGIKEGMQSDARKHTDFPARHSTEHMAHSTLREVVRFNFIING